MIKPFITCKDHLVSGEEFDLFRNENFEILETKPVPENLDSYYKSEDYISHTDSKSGVLDKVYALVKNYMLEKKMSWINEYKTNGTLLDIGAGTGDFLVKAKSHNWEVNGVEPNSSARNLAASKSLILKEDISEIANKSCDVISMWHVLEHVPNLELQIQRLKDILKNDGLLIIAVPNYKSYDALYYKNFWGAYDVPRHLWHFSQKGISDLFTKSGFRLVETKPLKFDSYYVSLLSEKYKNGRSNFINSFRVGFLSNLRARSTSEYSSLVYFFKKA